jgi:hypothetical protein
LQEFHVLLLPDPSIIAPPLDRTVANSLARSTAFLYQGANAIQTGVAAGTIDFMRIAVLKGKVSDDKGNTLSGVKISILNHPEFGQTLTRADGIFDLVVNGGGILTIVGELWICITEGKQDLVRRDVRSMQKERICRLCSCQG